MVTYDEDQFESELEITVSEVIKFTLVIHGVGTLNFTTSEVQSIWCSIPDNRKVYIKIKDEDLGLIFVDVYKKHQFMELLAFKPIDAPGHLKLRILTWNHARSSQRNAFVCDPEQLIPEAEVFDIVAFAFQEVPRSEKSQRFQELE